MKILIINWRDIKHPNSGGSEIYFYEIAKRLVRNGHEVVWLTSGFKNSKEIDNYNGIKFIRTGRKFSMYFMIPLKYLFNLRKNFDIIIDVENGIPFFSPVYKMNKNSKVILHIHHIHKDVWFRELPKILAEIGWCLERKIMPLIYKNCDIITLSESSKKQIIKNKISKKKNIYVINPGVKKYKLNKIKKTKEPSILFLNRIKKYKGLETLLNAIKILQDQGIYFKTKIAGSGEDLKKIKKLSLNLKLKNIDFLGRITEKEKIRLMQESWIFVNPSMKEGWGIVNIEASYCGTLVIGSNVDGIRDSVLNNKSGLLFKERDAKDLAEKIKQVLESKSKKQRLSKEAKKWASNFSWDKCFKEYEKIIKNQLFS